MKSSGRQSKRQILNNKFQISNLKSVTLSARLNNIVGQAAEAPNLKSQIPNHKSQICYAERPPE